MKTKVAIKSENVTLFGGIFYIMDKFSHLGMDKLIDRVSLVYVAVPMVINTVESSLFYTYYCVGDHIKDIGRHLELRPNTPTKRNAVTFRALLPSVLLLLVLKIVMKMPMFVSIKQTH